MNSRWDPATSAVDYSIYLDDWKKTSHRNLKQALCSGDYMAWQFIRIYSIRFYVFKAGSELMEMVHGFHWDVNEEDELLSRLYIKMIEKKKIDLYRHEAPIHFWLQNYVKEIIYDEYRKKMRENEIPVSQIDDSALYISDDDNSETDMDMERYTFGQKCFGELWRKNSIYAYVLLLKNKTNLSSKEVSRLLNHTNETNINKIHQRAMETLKKIAKEHQDGQE